MKKIKVLLFAIILLIFVIFLWFWKVFSFEIALLSVWKGLIYTILFAIPLYISDIGKKKQLGFKLYFVDRKTYLIIFLVIEIILISFDEKRIMPNNYSAKLRTFAGDELFKAKSYKEAIDNYLDAQEIAPNNLDIKRNIAKSYFKLGDIEKALLVRNEIVRNRSSKVEDMHDLGVLYFLKAHQLIMSKDKVLNEGEIGSWTLNQHRKIKSLFPNEGNIGPAVFYFTPKGVQIWGGVELSEQAKDTIDKAENCFLKVVEKQPNNISSIIALSQLYGMKAHYDKALEMAKKAIKMNPNHIGHYNYLIYLYSQMIKDPFLKADGNRLIIIAPNPKKYLIEIENAIKLAEELESNDVYRYEVLLNSYVYLFDIGILDDLFEIKDKIKNQFYYGNKLIEISEQIISRQAENMTGLYYLCYGNLIIDNPELCIVYADKLFRKKMEKYEESNIRAYKSLALWVLKRNIEAKIEANKSLNLNPANPMAKDILNKIKKEE